MLEVAATLPADHRTTMGISLLRTSEVSAREAVVGWLLDPSAEVRHAVASAIEQAAPHGAVSGTARPPLRVAALRRSSREIVDGARLSRRAISRTPCRCARQIAISSRSANDRERPDSGFAAGARCDGGMPPALPNHRAPTAGDTPPPPAASSLERPAAMAAQN